MAQDAVRLQEARTDMRRTTPLDEVTALTRPT
jgi:hypothetical protein